MIEDAQQTIDIATVTQYCAHTPSLVFTSATLSIKGAAATAVTESDLNGYGISLTSANANLDVLVQSTDTTLAPYMTFILQLSSTLAEETTWYDSAVVTINYSNPSVPAQCTIETYSSVNHPAITVYTVTSQSRNRSGVALAHDDDTYTVTMTRSDGNGSETYTTTASHQSSGLYQAQLTPLISGQYSLTVTMANVYTAASGVT